MSKIMSELRDHIEILESMREGFKKLLADAQRQAKTLQTLNEDLKRTQEKA